MPSVLMHKEIFTFLSKDFVLRVTWMQMTMSLQDEMKNSYACHKMFWREKPLLIGDTLGDTN